MLIAQITDTHLTGPPGESPRKGFDTASQLAAVLDHLAAREPAPAAVLITGDLVERGFAHEYAGLKSVLARSGLRLILLPGNHDNRAEMRAAGLPGLDHVEDGPFLHGATRVGALEIIALDTLREGSHGGALCRARLNWLQARLAATRLPALIAMHHPPFATGIPGFDALGFEGADGFADVIAGAPHVAAIVCGHVHRAITTRIGHAPAFVAPSSAYAYEAAFAPDAPLSVSAEPPGFALHHWDGARLTSHAVHLPAIVTRSASA